jgi:homoserine dehydrogenase
MVCPCLLSQEHPLFGVNGVFNAVFVHGNMLGDAMFYGSGAGKLPTASAVVGDVVEAAKNPGHNLGNGWSEEKLSLEEKDLVEHRFFLRLKGELASLREKLEKDFGMLQYVEVPGLDGEFGCVTECMPEGIYQKKAATYTDEIISMIRVED